MSDPFITLSGDISGDVMSLDLIRDDEGEALTLLAVVVTQGKRAPFRIEPEVARGFARQLLRGAALVEAARGQSAPVHECPDHAGPLCWGCLEHNLNRAVEINDEANAIPEVSENFRRAAVEANGIRTALDAHERTIN